ncbi:MAG: hypothetical protein CVV16_01395 [Gammaproteobacteria bacterium HGW-Gammaproteobacteria-6]|nr:MAG: hypothetical protein CVV16_01395 [Gammaproteobacteria bacterium HGW-Gammaproteobacteria-6]
MHIKAFLVVVLCGCMMLAVNATARATEHFLRAQAALAISERALGDYAEAAKLSLSELLEESRLSAPLAAANRAVSTEYRWYFHAVLAAQTLLLLLIALLCSRWVVSIARRQMPAAN